MSKESVYRNLGASNHTNSERAKNDFYATNPDAINLLFDVEKVSKKVLEPACGMGHLSKRMEELGHKVYSYDLVDRGYGIAGKDFLKMNKMFPGDIVTNPPFSLALEFIKKSLAITYPGSKCCFFLKVQFLEGSNRRKFFEEQPPKTIYVLSKRMACGKDGIFNSKGGAIAYAWWVWENGYRGNTTVKWIN